MSFSLPFLAAQAWLLLAALFCGWLCGWAWRWYQHTLRRRGALRLRARRLYFLDGAFGLAVSCGLLLLWLLLSGGQLRPAVFLWLSVGVFLAQLPPAPAIRFRRKSSVSKTPYRFASSFKPRFDSSSRPLGKSTFSAKPSRQHQPHPLLPLRISAAIARCWLLWQRRFRLALRRDRTAAPTETPKKN